MSVILGISESHNATACISKDGKILGCVSEERFTRVKNQAGYPEKAIEWCKSLVTEPIDLAVLTWENAYWFDAQLQDNKPTFWMNIYRNLGGSISYNHKTFESLVRFPETLFKPFAVGRWNKNHMNFILKKLQMPRKQILPTMHEKCHCATAFYGGGINKNAQENWLIFLLEGAGDYTCANVYMWKDGCLKNIARTPVRDSLGVFWAQITKEMGMKPLEHEYKIMGLAPYSKEENMKKTYDVMKKLIWVDGGRWRSAIDRRGYSFWIRDKLRYHRFDDVAGAVQKLTEDLICQWIKNGIDASGVHNIALCGGVFMNVKANMKIAQMPEVEKLFIFPSCSDESTAIGACYFGHQMMDEENMIEPLKDLYFGPNYDDKIEGSIDSTKFNIQKLKNTEKTAADLLGENKIVARCSGRMEWGARALGNRSIMANPSKIENIRKLNETIKNRDFWMPFTPSLLDRFSNKYIENPKNIAAPYMILCFESTQLARKQLTAAIHPADFTCRPQIVYKEWNPSYYKILENFKKKTGIGGILNTSFNLHGEPIVCTPQDALHTMENSNLEYLIMSNYLITKKTLNTLNTIYKS